jgi:hypothetical protein
MLAELPPPPGPSLVAQQRHAESCPTGRPLTIRHVRAPCHSEPRVSLRPSSPPDLALEHQSLLGDCISLAAEGFVLAGLRIVEPDVATGIYPKRIQGLAAVAGAEEIIPSAGFIAAGEVERQDEIRDLDAIDLVGLILHGVRHLVPMKDRLVCIGGVRSHDKQVDLWIGDQFERLVGKRHTPRFAQLLGELGEDKSIWNSTCVLVVIAQGIVDVGLVPQVENRVAAQIEHFQLARGLLATPLQPQRGSQTPIGFEVLGDLSVYCPNDHQQFCVRNLAIRVIDHGDNH